jgi:hypothetical protein
MLYRRHDCLYSAMTDVELSKARDLASNTCNPTYPKQSVPSLSGFNMLLTSNVGGKLFCKVATEHMPGSQKVPGISYGAIMVGHMATLN